MRQELTTHPIRSIPWKWVNSERRKQLSAPPGALQGEPCTWLAREPTNPAPHCPQRPRHHQNPHLVLQLLSAALHCAAQAALLGLLLISNLPIADGDFGLVRWRSAGVAHQTLGHPGFTLKGWLLHGGAHATAGSSLHQRLETENVRNLKLEPQTQITHCLRSWWEIQTWRRNWPTIEMISKHLNSKLHVYL